MSTLGIVFRKETISATLAMMVAASTLSCGSASAMSPSKAPSTAAAITDIPIPVDLDSTSNGDFYNGYELGLRNGSILATRLKQRTTDQQGCDAVDLLQNALIKVTRTVLPPRNGGDAMVSGFYSGYLDAIRGTLQEVREGCNIRQYSSGEFAGQLYGAVACQVQSVRASAISELELKPLYSGWSGGSSSVQTSCRTQLLATIQSCSDGSEISASIDLAIRVSCSDI